MPGDRCIVCGNNRAKEPGASFHHFPADEDRRATWLCVFDLDQARVKPGDLLRLLPGTKVGGLIPQQKSHAGTV